MGETLAGFPYFELRFNADGAAESGTDALLTGLPATEATDLFVISHGWNNSPDVARRLYERFFDEVALLLPAGRTIAVAGVIWPSMRWPDEGDPEGQPDAGGAASVHGSALPDRQVVAALKDVFPDDGDVLDELGALLDERPRDPAALARFQELVSQLVTPPEPAAEEDNQEQTLLDAPPEKLFERSARQANVRGRDAATIDGGGTASMDEGGAAGLGLGRLWEGAKQVLRQASYWEMKKRAGRVGTVGLGPLLTQLHTPPSKLRIHLIGHSFGARVVSYALRGLGDHPPDPSPIKSVLLVQGAFSHYAFANPLPHDLKRAGDLAGMQRRVDGPLVVTHSVHDLAVGRLYPAASLSAGQDAAGLADVMAPWGAIGHDGAQAVGAASAALGAPDTEYELRHGEFLNLDADDVIRLGRPPSGAHSDIFHPQLAWVVLAAAGLTGKNDAAPG